MIGDLLIIALSGFILAHLCLMLIAGPVLIYEDIKPVLIIEIVLIAGCFLLGIDRLWYDIM